MVHNRLRRWGTALGAAVMIGLAQAPDTIATINGNPISTLVFQQRVRFTRWTIGQQLDQILQQMGATALTDPASPYNSQYKLLSDAPTLGQQVIDSLITVKLVQAEAVRRGITTDDAEVQTQIQAFFGYTPDATPAPGADQPAPNATELAQNFEATRDNYFGQAGVAAKMTQNDVLATFAEQALQIKVFQAITADIPLQAEQRHVRHILVASEDQAKALLPQVGTEAAFAAIAKTNSLDTTNAAVGGDLGWAARGAYVPEFDAAVWSAQPGQAVGPIKTQFGYHLILVVSSETRPLSTADLARARDAKYRDWLKQARSNAAVQIVAQWQALIPTDPGLKDLGLPEPGK
jgi:parvulin-like peptidyl-prolyl isomerase